MRKIIKNPEVKKISHALEEFIKAVLQEDKEIFRDEFDEGLERESFYKAIDLIYKKCKGNNKLDPEIKKHLYNLWKSGKPMDRAIMERIIIAIRFVKVENVDVVMEPFKGYMTIIKAGSSHKTIKTDILYYYLFYNKKK